MKYKIFLQIFLLCVLTSARNSLGQGVTNPPSRNDHIFPAASAAQPYIDFDNRGFLINGKRTFIVSAGMEYARVPSGLWRDRLLRLKRGGFNTVEIYTFWNFHEPKEGKFDFSGDQDLDAFLKLVKDLDMYAIVRVGPYYCGEWNFGGYPIWLKFKPGLRVREDNPQFLSAVDKFFDKLIPIVAKNQIHHGGSVILVQLENEHNAGWGTVTPNGYFRHLINKTVSLGLQVPYYFSGLHPGNDPAGNVSSLDDPMRPNPWFSAEYWSVWFFNYGPQPQDSTIYDRRTWKIIAHGGNGYNVYMAHGGSNFDYNNDRDMAASYDYGAAVGQAGDLRPLYYGFKRAAWFARSFREILANSRDASNEYKTLVTDTAVAVTARSSPAGNIIFLDNQKDSPVDVQLNPPLNSPDLRSPKISLAAGEIMPVVQNYELTPAVKLLWTPVRIYSIIPQGNTTTLLIYGKPNSLSLLYFNVPPEVKILQGKENFRILPSGVLEFSGQIPSSAPSEYVFEAGGQHIRILAISDILAARSWLIETNGQNNLVIGPSYAGEAKVKNKKFSLITERPWQENGELPVWLYKPEGAAIQLMKNTTPDKQITELPLQSWEIKNASEPALPDYDDRNWKLSDEPLQMGADGDISANAWYRAKIEVPETGRYTLQFKNVRERAALFLDGKRIDTGEVFNKTINIDLNSGISHTITVFTAHNGRNKQLFYTGVIDSIDAKGLTGEVTLKKADGSGTLIHVGQWRMKGGPGDPYASNRWTSVLPSGNENSPAFFRTKFSLPSLKGAHPIWRVITTSLSYGSVWVNGHNLGRYPEKIKINGLYIPETWLKKGNNTLVIYDENGVYPEKVSIQAETAASRDVTIFTEKGRSKKKI